MTSDEVYKLIEDNGLTLHGDIEHFAALVASAEREACAKVCEEQMQGKSIWVEGARACSLTIRERGQA